uniref:Protein kinase domain-containing protein n=1 Tax=Cyprinodon variegatus TaxID=28743 RepID=A0A3Q2DVM4_CYPVA
MVVSSAPPDDNKTIQTPFEAKTTYSGTFCSDSFSTNDFVFKSETSKYLFISIVGKGVTAITMRCRNQETTELVVIKVGIDGVNTCSNAEKKILNKIKELGADNYNIVKFYEDFNYKTNPCLVFEELAIDLLMFTEFVVGSGLHLYDIRLIAQQVLVGLDFLHSNGIVHKDIKPNNIMLVDWSSLKVKLIDMGFTEEIGSMSNFYPNPLIFIPPEGIMRDKPDASLDMWCLGITLIYFYLKYFLFDYGTRDKTLAAIVKMLGEPHCSKTFSSWKNVIKKYDPVLKLQSLDDLLEIRPATQDPAEREDLLSFIDFLKAQSGELATVSVRDNPKMKSSPEQSQKPGFQRSKEVSRENPSRGQSKTVQVQSSKIQAVRPKITPSRTDSKKGTNQKYMGKNRSEFNNTDNLL